MYTIKKFNLFSMNTGAFMITVLKYLRVIANVNVKKSKI